MKTGYRMLALAVLLPAVLTAGCSKVRAKAAFKDGNKEYKTENFKKAAELYRRAIELDPTADGGAAYFYLASSHQAMYRPGKEFAGNAENLEAAIENYNKALETIRGQDEKAKTLRMNAFSALAGIYSEDPKRNYETAIGYANQLVQENPNDEKNLFAIANLYEKFDKIAEAEQTYVKVDQLYPKDPKVCGALAAFYNKALWDGKSRFEESVSTLERCATLDPNNPSGYYTVASFYWNKAYRDPEIRDDDAKKAALVDKGMVAVEKALALKPDHWESMISKGLLLRVKASLVKDPRTRFQLIEEAAALQNQAMDLRKKAQEETAQAQAAAGTAQ
jgi:tetratricopeptide (TPR) repeat protein